MAQATEGIVISTDRALLDVALIHRFLSVESYWSIGISRAYVEKAIAGSLCVGAYMNGAQVGFARVVSDGATFAYLCDVFVVSEARGRGVGKTLVRSALDHENLRGLRLRRWLLATRDAHGLYDKYGFRPLLDPSVFMERCDPDAFAETETQIG